VQPRLSRARQLDRHLGIGLRSALGSAGADLGPHGRAGRAHGRSSGAGRGQLGQGGTGKRRRRRQDAEALAILDFALAFATRKAELDAFAAAITARAGQDPLLWFAYPKGSSKRYRCDFNRDTGWEVLGAAGYEPVRQVAIDEDWSALRFRRVERIAKLTRHNSMALSAAGKARTKKG
jgi:hypothetical protein